MRVCDDQTDKRLQYINMFCIMVAMLELQVLYIYCLRACVCPQQCLTYQCKYLCIYICMCACVNGVFQALKSVQMGGREGGTLTNFITWMLRSICVTKFAKWPDNPPPIWTLHTYSNMHCGWTWMYITQSGIPLTQLTRYRVPRMWRRFTRFESNPWKS